MSEYRIREANAGVWTVSPATEAHTKGRITTLIRLSKEGDTQAKERLLEEHLAGIIQIVSGLKSRFELKGDEEEAVRAGQAGLVDALTVYNPQKGDFKSYIRPFIIGRVVDSLTGHRK